VVALGAPYFPNERLVEGAAIRDAGERVEDL